MCCECTKNSNAVWEHSLPGPGSAFRFLIFSLPYRPRWYSHQDGAGTAQPGVWLPAKSDTDSGELATKVAPSDADSPWEWRAFRHSLEFEKSKIGGENRVCSDLFFAFSDSELDIDSIPAVRSKLLGELRWHF